MIWSLRTSRGESGERDIGDVTARAARGKKAGLWNYVYRHSSDRPGAEIALNPLRQECRTVQTYGEASMNWSDTINGTISATMAVCYTLLREWDKLGNSQPLWCTQ